MRLSWEQKKMCSSLKSASREELRKTLITHRIKMRELCQRPLPFEAATRESLVEAEGTTLHPFNKDGLYAVHHCALAGDVELLQELLEHQGRKMVSLVTKTLAWTPLHFAAYGGSVDTYRWLVEAGADVHACTADGWTVLHLVAARGHQNLVREVIISGVDVNATTSKGNSPLHISVDLVPYARPDFHLPDREELVGVLAEQSNCVACANDVGDTPLHVSLRSQLGPTILRRLLAARDAGEAIRATNQNGQTPLHLVDSAESAALLLDAGSPIHARSADGRTALHAHCTDPGVLRQLLARGADPAALDNQGRTPLHLSLCREEANLEALETLLSVSTDLHAGDNAKNTPLHLACWHSHANLQGSRFRDPLLELLIKAGLHINAQNKKGESPLHLALRSSQYTKAGMLIRAGANVDLFDQKGSSPRNMDNKWVSRMLYNDPFDTRSRSNLSGRSSVSPHSRDRSPRDKDNSNSTQLGVEGKAYGKLLDPGHSPARHEELDVDELLESSEGIDELTNQLGLSDTSPDDQSEQSKREEDRESRERLQSQISSLRSEMTCLHDVLEGYAMTPQSPPCSSSSRASQHDTERQYGILQEDMGRMSELVEETVEDPQLHTLSAVGVRTS